MTETYEEFCEFLTHPGAKATIMKYSWLAKGCPYCNCKKWTITSDGWAYCYECHSGFDTYGIWTSQIVEVVDFTEDESKNDKD